MPGLRRKLLQALPVVQLSGRLVLRYHAPTPKTRVSRLADGPPFWAYLWPGGAALIAHIEARPETVPGLRVLDLGAGCGLVGIAAAKTGAGSVIASETDPVAQEVLSLNDAENGVSLTLVGDLLNRAVPPVDLIVVGDLFYDPDVAARVIAFLTRAKAIPVLVGDIGRATLPVDRLEPLAPYPVRDVGEAMTQPHRPGTVFRFRQ